MKKCLNCGCDNTDISRYCKECGYELSDMRNNEHVASKDEAYHRSAKKETQTSNDESLKGYIISIVGSLAVLGIGVFATISSDNKIYIGAIAWGIVYFIVEFVKFIKFIVKKF